MYSKEHMSSVDILGIVLIALLLTRVSTENTVTTD
jgi:hypothetical protein